MKSAQMNLPERKSLQSIERIQKAFIDFLFSRKGAQLWPYEDLSARNAVYNQSGPTTNPSGAPHPPGAAPALLPSVRIITEFIDYIVFLFKQCASIHAAAQEAMGQFEERLALVALHMALSCSSRHLACRSFQIFRALTVTITPRVLNDILTRLIETVAEQNEDLQVWFCALIYTYMYY